MAESFWMHVQLLLDLSGDPTDPGAGSMALRTVGSIMSRAINGSAPFVPTLAAGAVLLFLHWAFAAAAFRVHWIGAMVKGTRIPLIRDGKVLQDGVRRAQVSEEDLAAVLRLQIQDEDVSRVALAYMERSGQISVIPRRRA